MRNSLREHPHETRVAALVDWLRVRGRMAEVDFERRLHVVREIGQRALFMIAGPGDIDVVTLASAIRSVQTHLEAAVVDHDPAALAFLLEGL